MIQKSCVILPWTTTTKNAFWSLADWMASPIEPWNQSIFEKNLFCSEIFQSKFLLKSCWCNSATEKTRQFYDVMYTTQWREIQICRKRKYWFSCHPTYPLSFRHFVKKWKHFQFHLLFGSFWIKILRPFQNGCFTIKFSVSSKGNLPSDRW